MTEEITDVITFDGVEYPLDSITEKGRYIISQLQDMRQEDEDLRRKLDRLSVTTEAFTALLGEELKGGEESDTRTAEDEFIAE